MIVDLLRNDIGADRRDRLGAGAGALRGRELCDGAPDGVAGDRAAAARARGSSRVLAALFPCGSVTGAPKLRAMEIIRELEPWPREAYCGAIGWAAPDGRASFNVAIRTLALYPGRRGGAERRRRGRGGFDRRGGIRGGPVESALRRSAPGDLTLIETFALGAGGGLRPAAGASGAAGARRGGARDRRSTGRRSSGRWRRSAGGEPLRVRLTLAARRRGGGGGGAARRRARRSGRCAVAGGAARLATILAAGEDDASGARYDAARAALPAGVDEVVFLNERGEVCEGTITNVFARSRAAGW